MDFSLDDNHVYRLNGQIIPGCTSVLKALGCYAGLEYLSPEDLQWHGERGHAIAKGVELSCRGELDKRTLDKTVRPYLIGWERARSELQIEVLNLNQEPFVETALCHPVMKYGVKPDVVAYVHSFKDSGVIEIKATAADNPATAIQTASQLIAVRTVLPKIGKLRASLRLLTEEPYYKFKVYDDPMDETTWLSMLNTYRWLNAHKLLKQRERQHD